MPDASDANGGPLQWRIWHFQSGNWEHLLRWIPKAPGMGINGIHITENAVAWPWDVLDNPERVANLQRVFKTAKDNGLFVHFWMREISQVPDQYLRDGKAVLCDGLWDWLRDRYERIFDLLSNADGMILTTNECKYVVFRDLRVISDLPHEQRIAKLVDVIAGVLHDRGKRLIVRTFAYEPRELEFMRRAMQLIKPLSDKYGNITALSKCVPMDWSPFWPYNPLLGEFGRGAGTCRDRPGQRVYGPEHHSPLQPGLRRNAHLPMPEARASRGQSPGSSGWSFRPWARRTRWISMPSAGCATIRTYRRMIFGASGLRTDTVQPVPTV